MSRPSDILILALLYSLLVAAAVVWPFSAFAAIPAGLAVTAVILYRRRRQHARHVDTIQRRLSNLRSEGLFLDGTVGETGDDVFYRMILTLLTDLERTLFKLVEKNIQLLSLKEIGRSIISSLDEKKLVDSVFQYLVHGVGYKEAAFIILRRRKECFQAVVTIERATRHIRRVVSFGQDDLSGAVLKSLSTGKAFLIKDVRMHPLVTVQGEALFPGSTMTSYICVPLTKSSGEFDCFEKPDCALAASVHGDEDSVFLGGAPCLSCPDNPLLGALIVTDGYRASPLTNIDHVTLETVGSLVSSNIENWMLYQELRQEELFREKVFEGMLHGLVVSDLEGRITFANRSACLMSGYSERQLLNSRVESLLLDPPGPDGESKSSVFRLLRSADTPVFNEAYLAHADGMNVPVNMNVSKMIGDDNDVQGAIVLFVDLSEIKRMEEQIRHLDTLAVLGRFTSAIAHEVRNPLTGIAAGIQYLNRSTELDEEQRESISFILNEVDRINRIITDLFKVAKPRDLLYQSVDIRDVIERSGKSVSETLEEKGVDFTIAVDGRLPAVDIDPDQITQVMINLVKNSAEAVGKGGRIAVTARPCGHEGDDPVPEK
ncbi:MAG: PAS domain S-box protein, partial [Candidatus Krumholzibacteria bacterium]|nr:PAS domain S-box protein [Candidatus Krumholzibacteria bacterium]